MTPNGEAKLTRDAPYGSMQDDAHKQHIKLLNSFVTKLMGKKDQHLL